MLGIAADTRDWSLHPDFGDGVDIKDDEIPVFWASLPPPPPRPPARRCLPFARLARCLAPSVVATCAQRVRTRPTERSRFRPRPPRAPADKEGGQELDVAADLWHPQPWSRNPKQVRGNATDSRHASQAAPCHYARARPHVSCLSHVSRTIHVPSRTIHVPACLGLPPPLATRTLILSGRGRFITDLLTEEIAQAPLPVHS